MTWEVRQGDVLDRLREMPDGSVHCCVTSPPYWGLRDYGVDGQIGLEATPEAYVARMVEVFREVRRVLRDDGTLWLNIGDSYAAGGMGGQSRGSETFGGVSDGYAIAIGKGKKAPPGYKPKDLVGIPWLLAFALRADGWYLRSDIIWAKPNPMPESVTDRPTKAHEYVFLLTKSARYYFDNEAIRQPVKESSGQNMRAPKLGPHRADGNYDSVTEKTYDRICGANARTVWTIATQPYPEAHFATYPEALVEPCILAGTSAKGCCPACGKGWERVMDVKRGERDDSTRNTEKAAARRGMAAVPEKGWESTTTTLGWSPACTCHAAAPVPAVVLDPFSGSGTSGAVAVKLGRSYIGIELSPQYVALSLKRIGLAERPSTYRNPQDNGTSQAPLFALAEEGEPRDG